MRLIQHELTVPVIGAENENYDELRLVAPRLRASAVNNYQ